MKIVNCENIIQQIDFIELEIFLGTQLPQSFKSHYISFNGGDIEFNENENNSNLIGYFLSIKFGTETVEKYLFEPDNMFPKSTLPFAVDVFGNFFIISLNYEDFGIIYRLIHEVDDMINDIHECHLICKSFDEFVASLT